MIAFLLCEFQNRPDWVFLTTYAKAEMKAAAKAIAAGEFKSLSRGECDTGEKSIKAAVYANWNFSTTDGAEDWEKSAQDIAWLIVHSAERFATAHEGHGLQRVARRQRDATY